MTREQLIRGLKQVAEYLERSRGKQDAQPTDSLWQLARSIEPYGLTHTHVYSEKTGYKFRHIQISAVGQSILAMEADSDLAPEERRNRIDELLPD